LIVVYSKVGRRELPDNWERINEPLARTQFFFSIDPIIKRKAPLAHIDSVRLGIDTCNEGSSVRHLMAVSGSGRDGLQPLGIPLIQIVTFSIKGHVRLAGELLAVI
jgi:hypothetical protein